MHRSEQSEIVASVDGLLPIWPHPGISPGRSTNPAGQTEKNSGLLVCLIYWREKSCYDEVKFQIHTWFKVIYTKYSKHWPYTVAHTLDCVCSEMNNPWFKPWFIILMHTESIVCATV